MYIQTNLRQRYMYIYIFIRFVFINSDDEKPAEYQTQRGNWTLV